MPTSRLLPLITLLLVLAADATIAQSPATGTEVTRETLIDAVRPDSLRAFHDLSAGRPHPAGSDADREMAAAFAERFAGFGAEVESHEIWPYLAFPKLASLTIVGEHQLSLPIQERPLTEDADSKNPALGIGWNAYAASGVAEGEVVYANQGRKEDFERLRELGVDCRGKIVIARYGGNYRGFKWKFAEAAGAAGLVIFTDPKDSGWGRGLPWPEGGFANETSIQRGSILTLPYAGDPLTPGRVASRDAKRLDPADVAFPKIPVQPVGWCAAREILRRMRGAEVPGAWQGGLPFRYRLTGGPKLRVRVEVEQERRRAQTFNVVATFRAERADAPSLVFGSHHDAWTFGAGDPAAGVMTVLEAARVIGEAYAKGWRPEVDLVFALWGAEEHGIIGSTEWVESREGDLKKRCLAYVNLDMAAMGLDLRASASPSLKGAIARAAAHVPDPRDGTRDVLSAWRARGRDADDDTLPRTGVLGGGSDHVAFLARAGVACGAISAGGSRGTSYHSNYDDLVWYRKIVGDDYLSGRMVTQVVLSLAWDFARHADAVLDPSAYGAAVRRHLRGQRARAEARGLLADEANLRAWDGLVKRLHRLDALAALRRDQQGAAPANPAARQERAFAHARFDRAWLSGEGLPERPWYRNLFAAPDEDSGYAAWMLPALRRVVEKGSADELGVMLTRYDAVIARLERLWDQDRLTGGR